MPSGSADEAALRAPHAGDATPPPTSRPYFPCLEGLRALAATVVVVHHAASLVGPARAGLLATPAAVMDIGVAVFFVLSGFLIYRPFAAAHLAGSTPLRARSFWWRRIVRIVPAYWAALTILWASGSFHLGAEWWRYYLFLQVYDVFTTLGGIVPAWSLNTEMAFYLFVPCWSFGLRQVVYRRRPARPGVELAAIAVLGLGGYVSRAAISSSSRIWAALPGHPPVTMREVSFSWFPNNLDLFAAGMAVAVLSAWAARDPSVQARLDRIAGRAGPWWAAAAVLFAWFAYRVGAPSINGGYKGFYWQQRQCTFALVGVCLLVPAAFGDQGRGVVRAALRWRPVAWIGALSYGIYLWHQDLLERIPTWLDRPPTGVPVGVAVLGAFVLGTAAAAVSWYLLEQPVQRRAKRWL